jgi:hypothetical protein
VDRVTGVLLVALGVVERGLGWLEDARGRVELRNFRRDHPDVRFPRYPDGG